MRDLRIRSRVRRSLLLAGPAAIAAAFASAQSKTVPPLDSASPDLDSNSKSGDIRLPNGKKQQDEILKADYEKNLKDAEELTNLARSFEQELEKGDRFVFSISAVKKLDDIEKIARRIRGRIKRF